MKLNGMNVLVTGGAGFIGSHLVDLLAQTNSVTVVDDLSTGRAENLSGAMKTGKVCFNRLDLRKVGELEELVRGIDVIFHLAVVCLRASIRRPELAHEVNATATLNLLNLARTAGIRRFIYCSSSEVYGTARSVPMGEDHALAPMTIYGASKLAGEQYALSFQRTYGLPVVAVRPFNSYGPRAHYEGVRGEVIPRFIINALSGRPLAVMGDGAQTRDFTYVTDVARGLALAAQCDALIGSAVNIAAGREISVNEIAERVAAAVGVGVQIRHVEPRPGDVRRHWADISRAKELLGYMPEVSFEEGLASTVDWLRRNVKDIEAEAQNMEERNW